MMKTIQAALSPLLIIISFCGLGIFEYPRGRLRPYLSCLYFLIVWSLYSYLFYYLIYRSNIIFLSMSWTEIIMILSAIVSMLVSLFRFKELKVCLNKISIVDDTLEILGTPKEYQWLYNWIIRIIIVWIILTFFMNAFDVLWLSYNYISIIHIIIPFVGNQMFHINSLSGLTWGIIIGYIGSRFQRINKHIHDMLESDTECTERLNKLILIDQRSTEAKKYRQYIWIIMHVHQQLCLILRELNKVFNIQMTIQMAAYFAFFIQLFREIYTTYTYKQTIPAKHMISKLVLYFWAIVYGVKLFTLNHICQIVCDKANETIAILHKLCNDNPGEDLREQILQFLLQIKQREVKFSGIGLFCFGYSFIRKFKRIYQEYFYHVK